MATGAMSLFLLFETGRNVGTAEKSLYANIRGAIFKGIFISLLSFFKK
jgi:hypothetical protein